MSELTYKDHQRSSPHELTMMLCLCCLEKGVTFVNLSTCKHFEILEKLCSISVPKMELGRLVCYRCHAKLKTIHDFKLQAEESFTMLLSRQYSEIEKDSKLNEVLMEFSVGEESNVEYLPEKLHTYRTPIKAEQNPLRNYSEVFSGSWLDDPHSPPVCSLQPGLKINVSADKIKKEFIEVPDKVTNYHLEVSGLCLGSSQDIEVQSEYNSDDNTLANIKREVEITEHEVGAVESSHFGDDIMYLVEAAVDTGKKTVHCTLCNKKLASLKNLKLHIMNMHHKPKKKLLTPSKQEKLHVYAGIIEEIILTHEELMSEREMERMSETYLQKLYRCDSCIVSFTQEQILKNHNARKHQLEENSFECEICKSVYKTPQRIKDHKKTHYIRYKCMICQNQYVSLNTIMDHCNLLHAATNKIMYSCNQCEFTTMTRKRFHYHVRKHSDKPQLCLICGNTFTTKYTLKKHMFKAHGNYRPEDKPTFQCDECNKTYSSKHALAYHYKLKHEPPPLPATDDGPARFYCDKCKRNFRDDKELKYHLKSHRNHRSEDDKRFICDICNLRFFTKGEIKSHITWIHLKTSEFTCSQCRKSYCRKSSLKQHVKSVHEKVRLPKTKICDYCGEAFQTARILQCHIRRHTGERPYQCAQCPSTFTQRASWHTHIKLVHTKKKREK